MHTYIDADRQTDRRRGEEGDRKASRHLLPVIRPGEVEHSALVIGECLGVFTLTQHLPQN